MPDLLLFIDERGIITQKFSDGLTDEEWDAIDLFKYTRVIKINKDLEVETICWDGQWTPVGPYQPLSS